MEKPDGADSLQELTARVQSRLDVAFAIVTKITEDRQFVLAHAGRPLPSWYLGSTTLDYSICQHSAAMDFPLVIDDAFSHPLLRGNLAVTKLSVAAYIAAPVHAPSGVATGAICAVEFHQRRWTEDEIRFIIEAAHSADRILAALD